MTLWLAMTAFAGERTCVWRELPLQVAWDASGVVTVREADQVVVEVQAGPLPGRVTGHCRPDGLRLVADEPTGRLGVTTVQLDFGASFDSMPARFDPARVRTLVATRAVAAGDWAAVRAALDAGALPEPVFAAVLVQAAGDAQALEAARAALPPHPPLDDALATAHLQAGQLDQALAVAPTDSPLAGEILWRAGDRTGARRVWMAAAARGVPLSPTVRDRCPRCRAP